jgi:hypothetical protein
VDEKYPKDIKLFATNKHFKKYLDCGCMDILVQRANSLKNNIKDEWEFSIPRDHPLVLKHKDQNKKVVISCAITGNGSDIKEQNIELKVFSCETCEKHVSSREICGKHVFSCDTCKKLFEFHIDLKDPKAKIPEPLHHLHVLGHDEPRFPFPPMDIILLSEFAFINYFPKESEELRSDPSWKNLVIHSQEIFVKPYYEKCQRCLESNEETLMGHLINLR